MRGLFLLCLCGLFLECYSQSNESYTKFIENNEKISWAAEYKSIVNLTPVTNTVSLKKYYLDRIGKQGALSYSVIDRVRSDSALVKLSNLQRQEWLKDHYVIPSDNPERWEFRNKKAFSGYRVSGISEDPCCGCDEANAFALNQLVLYSGGKFSTRNIFLSPLCLRQKEESHAAWYSLGNFAWNTSATRPSTSTYLTRSSVTYNIDPRDSIYEMDILTLGDDMLMNHVLADIRSGKVTAHDIDTDKKIPYQDLLTWEMPYDTSVVYGPDDIAKYVVTQRVLEAADFGNIRLEQDWYYDFKTDRLFSEVRSATLLLQKRMHDGRPIGLVPFIRLKFR